MRYQELLDEVRRAGVPEPVEVTVSAVLTTLGEELPSGTAGYLATNLPTEVGSRVRRRRPSDDEGAHMDRSRFLYRVAQRGGCEPDEAGERVRTVLTAVAHGVPDAVMVDVAVAVPEDLLDLIPAPPGRF
ncbi:MAG: DUF2267 domain-containing protein [Actinobacteria bacterium]|nr:MAG: DUF2267 domain-containing protein [Actinomycetota bacterium]